VSFLDRQTVAPLPEGKVGEAEVSEFEPEDIPF